MKSVGDMTIAEMASNIDREKVAQGIALLEGIKHKHRTTRYYRKPCGDGYDYREYKGPTVTSIPGTTPMTVYPWKSFDDDGGCDERHQWDRFMSQAEEITEEHYVEAWRANLQAAISVHKQEIERIRDRLVDWDGTLLGALKGSDR